MPKKKSKPSLSEADKQFIYQTLADNFEIDEEYPLANLGWCLAREGISKEDYGFIKLTPMLEQMDGLVELSSKEVGGVTQSMFRLLDDTAATEQPRPGRAFREKMAHDIDAHLHKQEQDEPAAETKKGSRSASKADAKNGSGKASGKTASDKKPEAKEADAKSSESKAAEGKAAESKAAEGKTSDAKTSGTKASGAKTEDKKGEAKSEDKQPEDKATSGKGSARKGATSKGGKATGADGGVASDKAEASDSATTGGSDADASGETAARSAGAGKPDARPVGSMRPRTYRVLPGRVLERFAYLGDWQEFLADLADLALDEPWDFKEPIGPEGKRFNILYNYIRYTFYRLTLEDKVGYSRDERFAAFNTGLVDNHYEDIYACFEPNEKVDAHQPWAFAGFCIAGTGHFGKKLVRELMPLPQPASYLERKEDLLFDLDREIVCDLKHIVVDNIHRLPVAFLRDELASVDECREVLAGIEQIRNPRTLENRYDRLRTLVSSDTHLFNRMSNAVNAAIEMARRQVRWNYKTAVPAYYPRSNSMNLLLPLNLAGDDKPDVALVVELQKSGNYQGQTIVTMAQAYCDARLVCRPYIDWLSPSQILDTVSQDDDQDEADREAADASGSGAAAEEAGSGRSGRRRSGSSR